MNDQSPLRSQIRFQSTNLVVSRRLLPTEHLAISGNIFYCRDGGGTTDIWWVEPEMLLKPPTGTGQSAHKELAGQNVNRAKVEKSCLNLTYRLRNPVPPRRLLHSVLGLRRLVWNAMHQLPAFHLWWDSARGKYRQGIRM